MKRLDITVPGKNEKEVEEVLEEFSEDITSSDVEKEDKKYIQFQVTVKSEKIDELTESVKHIKDIESGDLTIEILEETARIEKGKQMESVSAQLSTQEMYSKALSFSTFNKNSWVLIALSAGIAELGIIMGNVMVVVGAMVIAPLLGPFISASFGLVIGDRRLIQDSLVNAFMGMALAVLIAFIIPKPTFEEANALMMLISNPNFVTIPLSLFVGSAAALTFVSGSKEQLAGVAVAIALVPPAAVAGLSLSLGNISMFFNTLLIIFTNMASLILAGSLTFKLTGVSPSTYYRKKVSEEKFKKAVVISVISILLISGIVGYLSYQNIKAGNLKTEVNGFIDEQFSGNILSKEVVISENAVSIKVVAVNPQVNATQLEHELTAITGLNNIDVRITSVEGRRMD